MRSSTDASLAPWPMRILRPWLIASAAGMSIGTLLLTLSSDAQPEGNSYAEPAPRAAVYDAPRASDMVVDPFAPASSLAAPPEAPGAPLPAGEFIVAPATSALPHSAK